ncbi:MAG: hypothetical protein V1728_03615 [Candidatus Micrarchaeota archaeon]
MKVTEKGNGRDGRPNPSPDKRPALALYERGKQIAKDARHYANIAKRTEGGPGDYVLAIFERSKISFDEALRLYREAKVSEPDRQLRTCILTDISEIKSYRTYVKEQIEQLNRTCQPFKDMAMTETIYL